MTNQMKAMLYLAIATLAFSSMELAGKMVVGHMTSLQVTLWRFAIGLVILIPLALIDIKKRRLRLTWQDAGWLTLLGVINIPLAMVLLQQAVSIIPASLAAIIISSNPIFVVIFAGFLLNEKITLEKVIGLLLSVFGLCLVTRVFGSLTEVNIPGVLMAISAALFFGLYTVLSKKVVKKLGGVITNAGSFFAGSCVLLAILLLKGEPILQGVNQTTVGPVLYLGLVVTGFAYFCFLKGLSLIDASKGAIVFFFKPIVASLLAFLILHEAIGMNKVIGTAFVICGSAFMVLKKSRVEVPIGGKPISNKK